MASGVELEAAFLNHSLEVENYRWLAGSEEQVLKLAAAMLEARPFVRAFLRAEFVTSSTDTRIRS
jgi:hypothetical protein